MRKFASLGVLMLTAVLSACGGGDDNAFETPGAGGGGTNPSVASVSISSSVTQLLNDGTQTATLTAFVRNAQNGLLPNVSVTFTATSGGISPSSVTTNASGAAVATLSLAGDTTLRNISVTASASGFSATTTVQVIAANPPPTVGTLTLTTSSPTLPSDNSLSATITAIVRDAQNRLLANVPVNFSSSTGAIATSGTGTTNASGQATATLTTPGDPSNRAITVSATAGAVTQTINVDVAGTTLTVAGPPTLALNAVGTYTITLADSAARGITGRAVTVTATNGNTVTPGSVTTDSQGRATVQLTVNGPGAGSISATGLGLVATQSISVNADSFLITTPALNGAELALTPSGSPLILHPITVRWLRNGVAVQNQQVSFATTRGSLSSATATTDANGDATVSISSQNAGAALLSATASLAGVPVAVSRATEFVALTAASIDVQPGVFTIAPRQSTTITAIVRDAGNNLVKNKTVTFTLADNTGGSLSVGSAITDSQGRAQTVYTAGSGTSAQNGVQITASVVQSSPPVTPDAVSLTVAQQSLFISLGTGNTIEEPNPAQYRLPFAVQVTDANGNGVAGVNLTMSVLSIRYLKGQRAWNGSSWLGYAGGTPTGICPDEDVNRNGVLDVTPTSTEDANSSGRLEAGNVALVTPSSVTTDATGVALIGVVYPQEHAYWLEVTLEARAGVAGTETARATTFLLPGAANDFNREDNAPPGPISPFGVNVCAAPN
jgi:hypothetical protein